MHGPRERDGPRGPDDLNGPDDLSDALEGVRVLDFSQGIAAPHAASLLREMGADVVKIEPPAGDWLRRLGVKRGASSVLFGTYNRGKRGLALDLKNAAARELARELIRRADVLFESNRPGVMARLGLDYASVRALNPGLVYVSVTGYGQGGPYVDRPATDAAIQAYTGFAYGAGDMKVPVRVRISMVDVVSGVYISQAVLGALLKRARNGEGRHLDLSLMHCITAVQGYKYAEHEATGGAVPTELFAAIGIYETADGYVALSAMKEEQVLRLIRLLDQEPLLDDERFATPEARFRNQAALREVFGAIFRTAPTAHWLPRMQAIDLICQDVLTYDRYRRDPQVLAQRLFLPTDLGEVGTLPTVRMPGVSPEGAVASPSPRVGEHTRAVLRDYGVDEARIDRLVGEGAVRVPA